MSVARIAVAVIAVVIIGVSYFAFAVKSEKEPGKIPDRQNPGIDTTETTAGVVRAERIIDNLEISVSVPSAQFKLGEIVHFNISVKNLGSELHELTFGSGQKFDVRIEDESGRKVWNWSDGRVFTQALETVVIESGKSISYTAEWPMEDSAGNPVNPGKYNAFAKITAMGLSDSEVKLGITINPAD